MPKIPSVSYYPSPHPQLSQKIKSGLDPKSARELLSMVAMTIEPCVHCKIPEQGRQYFYICYCEAFPAFSGGSLEALGQG